MKNKAFTLVEIMIVVAIIALIASIAIPHLNRARLQGQFEVQKKKVLAVVHAIEMYQANRELSDQLEFVNVDKSAVCDEFNIESNCGLEFFV